MTDPNSRFQELKEEYEEGNADWEELDEEDADQSDSDEGSDSSGSPAMGTLDTDTGSTDEDGSLSSSRGGESTDVDSDVKHTFEQLKSQMQEEEDGDQSAQDAESQSDAKGKQKPKDIRNKDDPTLELDETRRLPNGEVLTADFIASFIAGGEGSFDPVQGRVLMSDSRLVLARNDSKTVIPIKAIFDLAVGQVPPEVEQFFDHTLMIGYVKNRKKRRAIVGGSRSKINKFALMVFRGVVNNSGVRLVHPAVVGGRQQDTEPKTAKVELEPDAANFHIPGGDTVTIDLPSVIGFDVNKRQIDGDVRIVLSVKHMQETQVATTEISMDSRRKMHVLGRYLRMTYSFFKAEIQDLELDEQEMETLTAIYSAGTNIDIGSLLNISDEELQQLLDGLVEKDLVSSVSNPELTPTGQMMVIREIEEVNL